MWYDGCLGTILKQESKITKYHAWYSAKSHEIIINLMEYPTSIWNNNVYIVNIEGVDVIATVFSSDKEKGELAIKWEDKVYLGEFDDSTQRSVPANTILIMSQKGKD